MLKLTGSVIGRNHKPVGTWGGGVMNNGQPWPIDQVETLEDVRLTIQLDAIHISPREIVIQLPTLPTNELTIGQRVNVTIAAVVPEVALVAPAEPVIATDDLPVEA